jgi:hypothetical protein
MEEIRHRLHSLRQMVDDDSMGGAATNVDDDDDPAMKRIVNICFTNATTQIKSLN